MPSNRYGWILILLCCLWIAAAVYAKPTDRTRAERNEMFKNIRENAMQARTKLRTPSNASNSSQATTQRKARGCPEEDSYFALDPRKPRPDFFVLGLNIPSATEIITMFMKHPRMGPPGTFDPGFWSFPQISADQYQDQFFNVRAARDDDLLYGDFSLSYLLHPLAPRRIAASIKNPKIVIILRNPVDRAYTQYLNLANHLGTDLTFEEVMAKELKNIVAPREAFRQCFNAAGCNITDCFPEGDVLIGLSSQNSEAHPVKTLRDFRQYVRSAFLVRSLYDDMVERWILTFGARNVLVIFHEDLYNDTEETLRSLTDFLDLPEYPASPIRHMDYGESENEEWMPLDSNTFNTLVDFFDPYNERLFGLIDRQDKDWKYHRTLPLKKREDD